VAPSISVKFRSSGRCVLFAAALALACSSPVITPLGDPVPPQACPAGPEVSDSVFLIGDAWRGTWRDLFTRIAVELDSKPPWLSLPLSVGYGIGWSWEGLYRLLGIRTAPFLTRYRVLVAGRDCHFASDKAWRLIGYQPKVGMDEAIRRSVAWYREESRDA
jgi:nucleoside-diphosphate-sugar epimerase